MLFMNGSADRIVAEVNNGGDLVERLLKKYRYRTYHYSFKFRATRGKICACRT